MEKETISIGKIKAILSAISMSILAIQHIVWTFADKKDISYIPLIITFVTVCINSLELKGIKYISIIAAILTSLSGFVMQTIIDADILNINDIIYIIYSKGECFCIGILCGILGILFVKRITEVN